MNALRVVLGGVLLAVALSSPADSATPRPSERACLVAWNARPNQANRSTVAAARPWRSASLRAGVIGHVTWKRGATPRQTSGEACLLTLWKTRTLRQVTGIWRNGRVIQWVFRPAIASTITPPPSNIRVLPDGRVTKVYRR
jgi:hypothetical protein